MSVKPIPDGYHSVTPYLTVANAEQAIDFYKRALGAEELFRLDTPDGTVMHAELQIGDSRVMLADENPGMQSVSPSTLGGSPCGFMVYVDNVDERFAQAVAAGGAVKRPLEDQFYGDRSGTIEDPFGHMWTLGTHVEDVSDDEVRRRAMAMMAEAG